MNGEQTAVLYNRKGDSLRVVLRGYRRGDEKGMIACIRDEYGDSYARREFYREESYLREVQRKRISFIVAALPGGAVIGTMYLIRSKAENVCEMAAQIIRRAYRGFGLAMEMLQYAMRLVMRENFASVFCEPVLFHDITQRLVFRLGMQATGFYLQLFDYELTHHSYERERNRRMTLGIQTKAMGKWNAGTVYFPEEHADFCAGIYKRLGVACRIGQGKAAGGQARQRTAMTVRNTPHRYLEIRIERPGLDLPERLWELLEEYPMQGRQTAGVLLNCNDPLAVWAYRQLEKTGFFFAGLRPLCGSREYMILHHPGELHIYFEDFKVSKEFAALRDYVRDCYSRQYEAT